MPRRTQARPPKPSNGWRTVWRALRLVYQGDALANAAKEKL